MIILKIIVWTAILTFWVFGTIACGMTGVYHFINADMHNDKEHYKQAAIWWVTCIAIASSALVSFIIWLAALN